MTDICKGERFITSVSLSAEGQKDFLVNDNKKELKSDVYKLPDVFIHLC